MKTVFVILFFIALGAFALWTLSNVIMLWIEDYIEAFDEIEALDNEQEN